MAGLYDRVDMTATPNPDVARGPERFCKDCPTLVATQASVLGFVGFLSPTEAFAGAWGPWVYCLAHLPEAARRHQEVPIK